jgi:hypothetical protein
LNNCSDSGDTVMLNLERLNTFRVKVSKQLSARGLTRVFLPRSESVR